MKKTLNRTYFLTIAFTAFSSFAFAQKSTEISCRNKAKDIALQTYSQCITEVRNSKINEIRKNYKTDLQKLKSKYDTELQSLESGISEETEAKKIKSKSQSAKGIAKTLPKRDPTETLSIRSRSLENSVADDSSATGSEFVSGENSVTDDEKLIDEVEVVQPN